MTPLNLVRRALDELGDISTADLCRHIARHFGATIEPDVVHIIRQTLQHQTALQRRREATGVLRLARCA
jgi:hypothetical protein